MSGRVDFGPLAIAFFLLIPSLLLLSVLLIPFSSPPLLPITLSIELVAP